MKSREHLSVAVHLYDKLGFSKVKEKPNTDWADYPMVEQRWEMYL